MLFFFSCPNEILGHVHRQSSAGGKWPDRGAINCLEMMLFWGGAALPFHQGNFHSKKLQNCTKQKVLLCNPSTGLRLELQPPSREGKSWAGACPEGGIKSEHEGIFNNEPVINPDRHAALGIAFQLLLVGGQIIPFHHISHYTAHLLSTFSYEALEGFRTIKPNDWVIPTPFFFFSPNMKSFFLVL